MTYPHFWGVAQLRLVFTDVLVQPFDSMQKGNLVCPEAWERICHSAQRNTPEERISLQFMRSWLQYIPLSLTENFSPTLYLYFHVILQYTENMSLNNMLGFVFLIDAYCVLCEVGYQSITYVIRLVGGVYSYII